MLQEHGAAALQASHVEPLPLEQLHRHTPHARQARQRGNLCYAPGATRCSDCVYASFAAGVNAALSRIPSSVIAKNRAACGQRAAPLAAFTAAAANLAGHRCMDIAVSMGTMEDRYAA